MAYKIWSFILCITLSVSLGLMLCFPAAAQIITGPADVGRIKPEEKQVPLEQPKEGKIETAPSAAPTVSIPTGADEITFALKEVRIVGATAFSPEELAEIYEPYLDQEITLSVAYMIAGMITEHYRSHGYFLSLAYLPQQRIKKGIITLEVIEGYVAEVDLPSNIEVHNVIQGYIDQLKEEKPLSAEALGSFLLRLNDLPGYFISGTLSELKGAEDGEVKLTLEVAEEEGKGQVSFDNFSSRFLGPNEVAVAYAKSLAPLQQTTISALTSLPNDELNYATFNHAIAVAPDFTLDFTGSYTRAQPGFTLEPFEIESNSVFFSAGLRYQWIRQRNENLSLKLSLDSRDSNSDLLDTPFTSDHIRAMRLSADYDTSDNWGGYNIATIKLSQGINGLGASEAGDIDLSRAEAEPDFTKLEFSVTRLQEIVKDWSLLLATSAQVASGPLYSAEEFGYGGESFGRAFDASEITGDHGISGSLELRYSGWSDWQLLSLFPYVFYDIGIIWNDDFSQVQRESGASAGFGLRGVLDDFGLNFNLGLAWPLTRNIATPIYGQESDQPRILLRISKDF